MLKEQLLPLFGQRIKEAFQNEKAEFEKIQEIRIRKGFPIMFYQNGRECVLEGTVSAKEIREIVEKACGYSVYAFEEEISKGYLTIAGGHRIGLAGRVVLNGEKIQTLKDISALNIRIAHPVKDCARAWQEYFYIGGEPCHVLIVSPPGCGKTTFLRDLVRILSDGNGKNAGVTVGVVDERSEIAGTYRGNATHNLGVRTDVLDGCPKALGMEMMLRSMAPKVLAVDEIGVSDVSAIESALRCGCKVAATLHGKTLQEFLGKPGFESLIKERVFERYIFLKQGQTPGEIGEIYDQDFKVLWEDRLCT